ncbi:hypothetical protein CXF80_17985 [Shewanella sp. Actino-trap-3]|jgi:hypothetical protein|uniref:hypothetical protein n=1 Tax=Shewanella sp. Actino-trap-3 TaxID=2058331 RepID=UPI000C342A30|nr:hypothetical protein [Shewanella sp. Actino-trap-3]PKG80041.1 hypothetical protein CXF80_17985 [Shewanella sp. Actino-trap-3]
MKSKAAFNHLLGHYRAQKIGLPLKIQSGDSIKVAMSLGALDCLYWQALGNGLTNLAKGIGRTIIHSYKYHQIRLPSHPKAGYNINGYPNMDIEMLMGGAA